MTTGNLVGDLIAIVASLVALSYVIGIWRMVHAPSRIILFVAMVYMVVTRIIVLVAEEIPGDAPNWVESNRALIIVPMYILIAIAMGMTYYELRGFRFDAPKDAEDLGALAAQDKLMREQSKEK